MRKYNGHRSWNAWNVSLWINNDEGLYRCAFDVVERNRTLDEAARELLILLPAKTPDGAKYNYTCVREAIREYGKG